MVQYFQVNLKLNIPNCAFCAKLWQKPGRYRDVVYYKDNIPSLSILQLANLLININIPEMQRQQTRALPHGIISMLRSFDEKLVGSSLVQWSEDNFDQLIYLKSTRFHPSKSNYFHLYPLILFQDETKIHYIIKHAIPSV